MKIIYPKVLILSSQLDFSTDYISHLLYKKEIPFLRINSEDYENINISINPFKEIFSIDFNSQRFIISPNKLLSIYFRRPVFLRETKNKNSYIEEIKKAQWTSFNRNLMLFDSCKWINHPQDTYKAESKIVQLNLAKKIGFFVPKTIIANNINNDILKCTTKDQIIAKSLDTLLINLEKDKYGFLYTNLFDIDKLKNKKTNYIPVIYQEPILNKIDYRITVIENNAYAVKVIYPKESNLPIDWRKIKKNLIFKECKIPKKIEEYCLSLVKKLNLKFGAIDLVFSNNKFYFIEINPTGEWGWLKNTTEIKFDDYIVEALLCQK